MVLGNLLEFVSLFGGFFCCRLPPEYELVTNKIKIETTRRKIR